MEQAQPFMLPVHMPNMRHVPGCMDPLKDLLRSGSLLLIGGPGAGKTTLLREAAKLESMEVQGRYLIQGGRLCLLARRPAWPYSPSAFRASNLHEPAHHSPPPPRFAWKERFDSQKFAME